MAEDADLLISAGFSDAKLARETGKVVSMFESAGQKAQKAFDDALGRVTNTQASRAHQRELDRLAKAYDPVYRATREYQSEVAKLDKALSLGAVTQDRYNALLDQAAQKQRAAMDAASGATARAEAAAKQAELAARAQAQAENEAAASTARLANEKEQLRLKLDPLYAASKRYEASLVTLDRALDVGAISAKQHEQALEQLNLEYAKTATVAQTAGQKVAAAADATAAAATRASGAMRGQIQNFSFQVQDFAVQVAAGTAATTALGQQLPQLLGGFGALGAVLGAVVAVGVPLAATFLGAGDAAKEMRKSIDDLNDAVAAYNAAAKNSGASAAELAEKFGAATAQAQDLYDRIARLQYIDAVAAVGTAITSLSKNFDDLQGYLNVLDAEMQQFGAVGPATEENIAKQIADDFGLTIDQARRFNDLLSDAQAAQSVQEKARLLNEISIYLDNAVQSSGNANKSLRDLARSAAEGALQSYELAKGADEAKLSMQEASDAASTIAANVAGIDFSNAIAGAGQLVAALQAGMSAIAALEGQQAMAVKRAQIARDFAGNKIGAAGANAELDFNSTYDAANQYQGPLTREMQADIDARRDAYIDGEKELARIQEATQARLKQITAGGGGGGGRKRSGGGGGGRAAKDPTDIFANAAQEIASLERQITLIGKSTEETARLQAQWELLDAAKKAGVPVNDELNARISAQADQVGRLTAELERGELAQQQFDQAVEGIANSFSNAILEGENLRDSLAGIFKQIAANIMNAGIQNALTQAFSGAGTGGGVLGSILSSAFGGTKAAVPSFDGGGYTWDGPRSGGLDGKGGRLAMLHPNETVLDHSRGQGRAVNFAPSTNITVQGSMDDRTMAQLRRELDMRDQRLANQVPSIMNNHQKRRG